MKWIGVVGSRGFDNYELLKRWLDSLVGEDGCGIVSGGARGADSLGERYADEHEFEKHIILPNWMKYGRSAGFKRNVEIVGRSDIIVAFWDTRSAGTKHSIDTATQMRKPVIVVSYGRPEIQMTFEEVT